MVLFICTANRCRSIICEYLFRYYLQQGLFSPVDRAIKVESAGIIADNFWDFIQDFVKERNHEISKDTFYYHPPYQGTIDCLSARGWSIGSYRSRLLNKRLVKEARLLVTLEDSQKSTVLTLFPEAASRTLTFREFVGESNADIADIYEDTLHIPQYDPEDPHFFNYERSRIEACYQAIERGLKAGAQRIANLLEKEVTVNE